MSRAPFALALALAAACSEPSVVGVPSFSTTEPIDVTLAPDDQILVDGTFRVVFQDVTHDSRCAIDVLCVWQGDGVVLLRVTIGDGPTQSLSLHVFDVKFVEYGSYRLRLVQLGPDPVSTSRIPRASYRATLRIEARS